MATFYLKRRDTRPTLEVELHDPAPDGSAEGVLGPVHPLSGATSAWLHIQLRTGGVITREMVIHDEAAGLVRYTFLDSDWTGEVPLVSGVHKMEYEVLGPVDARMSFPNDGHDLLVVTGDIGQA